MSIIAVAVIAGVLDGFPRSLQPAQKRDRRWEIALAFQQRHTSPNVRFWG